MREVYVILDNIRSAFNTGSIFRTSDAAGITKLYLCGITPYPPHNKLEKTALGSLESVTWEHRPSAKETVLQLKEQGIPIISVELDNRSTNYASFIYPEKFCLVMGHELMGVSQDILDISDVIVEIPMYGKKNSLNVAVSYGIVAYHSMHTNGQ